MASARSVCLAAVVLVIAAATSAHADYGMPGHSVQPFSLQSQFLAPHNAARLALGLHKLTWSKKLEQFAQWWADQRSYDCELVHSSGPYGENIFWGSGVGWTPLQAVAAWVDERASYAYVSNSCTGVCGHYTQVVWGETKSMGCAVATCAGDRGTFITCNYDPAGNYLNERPY